MTIGVRCPGSKLAEMSQALNDDGDLTLTSLAALTAASKSEAKEERTNSTDAMREGDNSAISRLHSDASERNIERVMRRDL